MRMLINSQRTKPEQAHEGDLLPRRHLEVTDRDQRKEKNGNVKEHIQRCHDIVQFRPVDGKLADPEIADRCRCKSVGKCACNGPGGDDADQDVGPQGESTHGKDSLVELNNGDLDEPVRNIVEDDSRIDDL